MTYHYYLTEDLIIIAMHWLVLYHHLNADRCEFCMDEVVIDMLTAFFPSK